MGGRSIFLSACDAERLRMRVQATGAQFVPLQETHPAASDLQNTLSTARGFNADWLVVDGYHFDSTYQEGVRAAGFRLMAIDDTCHLNRYHADIVLNQNISSAELSYNCEPDTKLLLGTRYALLRPEFRSRHPGRRVFDDSGNRVLVTLGGSDPGNVTLTVVEAFRKMTGPDLQLRFVIGPGNPHAGTLSSEILSLKCSAELLVDPPDMSELMAWADLAVSAAGSTCWELAFMGTPAVVLVTAQNQVRLARELSNLGVVVNMGWADRVTASALAATITEVLASGSLRTQMSVLGQGLVDGEGVDRVVMHLTGDPIRLRAVREEDRMILWAWANEPDVKVASVSLRPMEWDQHVAWFSEKLHHPSCMFLMALDKEDNPVGQVRFDICEQKPHEVEISMSLVPRCRNDGLGARIIASACQRLFRDTAIRTIHAHVRERDIASVKDFSRAGFRREPVTNVRGHEAVDLTLRKGESM